MAESCANCKFTRENVITQVVNHRLIRRNGMVCAKDSPTTGEPNAVFPQIQPEQWCGDWAAIAKHP